jgi:hydroxyacylglutathione hydrolase
VFDALGIFKEAHMHEITGLPAFLDNYIWVVKNETSSTFTAIDPGDALPVLEYASKNHYELTTLLLTHHHSDHVGGVNKLLNQFPKCVVYGPDDSRVSDKHLIAYNHNPIVIDTLVFQVFNTPGHTSSHISYLELNKGWLFCGDTLFSGGCGRVFDGTLEALYQSLLWYKSLPNTTKIFCAHEYTQKNLQFALTVEPNNPHILRYLNTLKESKNTCSLPSTIGQEKDINPFFRVHIPEVITYAKKHGAMSSKPLDVFSVLRTQKNNF